MRCFNYRTFDSPVGCIGIIWTLEGRSGKVARIILPNENIGSIIRQYRFEAIRQASSQVEKLRQKILKFLNGETVVFSLDVLDWSGIADFQRMVLMLESRIPRGMVSTYGRLAKKLGSPRAARAVGNALSRNPFPLLIPCHRAVRCDGSLGGFRGGVRLKKRLLEMEGIKLDNAGRVVDNHFW